MRDLKNHPKLQLLKYTIASWPLIKSNKDLIEVFQDVFNIILTNRDIEVIRNINLPNKELALYFFLFNNMITLADTIEDIKIKIRDELTSISKSYIYTNEELDIILKELNLAHYMKDTKDSFIKCLILPECENIYKDKIKKYSLLDNINYTKNTTFKQLLFSLLK